MESWTYRISWKLRALLVVGVAAISMLFVQAAQAQARVMPLGDSLTSSVDGASSYRYWLWKRIGMAGKSIDFVGTQWGVGDGASAVPGDFDQDHEGHPGATTDDILYSLDYYTSANTPDIVLLLIGGNDFDRGFGADHALANTRKIIDGLRAANPGVIILWAMLPPAATHTKELKAYNSGLLKVAPRWSTRNSPIRVVNLWSGFSVTKNTRDGEHPNTSGEKMYALRFYAAMAPYLSRF